MVRTSLVLLASLVVSASLAVALVNCFGDGASSSASPNNLTIPSPNRPPALLSLAVNVSAVSAAGNQGFQDASSLMVSSGGNAFETDDNWQNLETAPGQINFQAQLDGPVSLIVSAHPEIKGVVYILKMIDSNVRVMPSDLQNLAFDNPTVLARFRALIDALAADPSSAKISYLLLGNEVDSYLIRHPSEEAAFETLLHAGIDEAHLKLPNTWVGTVVTANGAMGYPALFSALNQYTDFIDYTYYPDQGNILGSSALQMKPMASIASDFQSLAQIAGTKAFAFTEIGCSSSTSYGSSEALQAQFVTQFFQSFKPNRNQNQIAFIIYQLMYDYAPNLCTSYAAAQGVSASAICPLMNGAGLRNYSDGTPKAAWNVFLSNLQNW